MEAKLALKKGIDFLKEHQFHNGQFACYFYNYNQGNGFYAFESNTFATSIIALCLLACREEDHVNEILDKADNFILYQKMGLGVWCYSSKCNIAYKYCPPDVDTTSIVSSYLEERNKLDFNNKEVFRLNVSKNGLLYTWMHFNPKAFFKRDTRWIFLRPFKRLNNTLKFYATFDMPINDVNFPININVLHYLGPSKLTQPIIDLMVKNISELNDFNGFKWYKEHSIVLYFISKCYKYNITDLENVRLILIKKTETRIEKTTIHKMTPLDLSFYISALQNLNCKNHDLITKLVNQLIILQMPNGSWEKIPLYGGYYGHWESEEITTAFAVEALAKYLRSFKNA